MARETKLGIALMVLLVGVFGFMVYKKWNSRQPTALASAAEVGSAPEQEGNEHPAAVPSAESSTEQATSHLLEPNPVEIVAGANPFPEPAQTTIPPRQAEPAGAFADEPFVRNSSSADAPTPQLNEAGMRADGSEPLPQETEPVFAKAAAPPAQDGESLEVETTPTAQPMPTASPDPFANAATSATSATATLTASPAPETHSDISRSAPAAIDDPFAESADSVGTDVAASAPESTFGDVADTEPAFSEETPGETLSTATSSPEFSDATSPPDQTNVATTDDSAADPFAGAVSEPDSPAPEDAEPARLFADEATDSLKSEAFEPTADGDLLDDGGSSSDATGAVTPVARTQGQNYVVVGENDSYWALSKRVYGTPAYFHALAKYNSSRIKDPNRLKAGMKVLTPERQELDALFPHLISRTTSSADSQETKSGLSWNAQGVPVYRVGDSDTLTGIAQAHLGRASRWVQIYEMNRKVVADPKTLRPGTVLRLPADASRVRLVPQG